MKAELCDTPDWMPLAKRITVLGGRRLRLCTAEGLSFDTRLEIETKKGPAHDEDFWCCAKIILHGLVHHLNFAAVMKIHVTDQNCLGTDLILILDP